ncbi:precorrin-6A reductase [Jannaschia pagri]|uniref:Precorrin-6A reductase n=1 Tax=Jannaschia pagri TaxID=2829797 RepID=A0ABQ4NNS6_9RHOB|nr:MULTISPECIES: precorrin-6A/cobalt-precorrin-6A reductase [unclassified Jannaschia]GIT92198.1 precorrin-6A reductase [Jannaschia sp. AI_61]GIT96033.1 precorrin-6A reductase [Jannaschia sp. AI_62]
MPRRKVLVLAGTTEARRLCSQVRELPVCASLAGATEKPADLAVPTRHGGFGGEAGFRAALQDVSAVVNATHPFAQRMTARAARLCVDLRVPYLRLLRPPWAPEPEWTHATDAATAARALPAKARVFLATGPGSLEAFLDRGLTLWCRRIDPAPAVAGVTWVLGRPPFTLEHEIETFRSLSITHLVTKNSGGGRAKLDAARALGIAVHMIDRPRPAPGETTHDIARAVRFIQDHAANP